MSVVTLVIAHNGEFEPHEKNNRQGNGNWAHIKDL